MSVTNGERLNLEHELAAIDAEMQALIAKRAHVIEAMEGNAAITQEPLDSSNQQKREIEGLKAQVLETYSVVCSAQAPVCKSAQPPPPHMAFASHPHTAPGGPPDVSRKRAATASVQN